MNQSKIKLTEETAHKHVQYNTIIHFVSRPGRKFLRTVQLGSIYELNFVVKLTWSADSNARKFYIKVKKTTGISGPPGFFTSPF